MILIIMMIHIFGRMFSGNFKRVLYGSYLKNISYKNQYETRDFMSRGLSFPPNKNYHDTEEFRNYKPNLKNN